MFSRGSDAEKPSLASPPKLGEARPIRSKNVSVIGPTLVFKGELSADEDLVIEGSIEGTIAHHKKNLMVGQEGRVKADIHASSVIIEGRVDGDIHSDNIVGLSKNAVVNGNIYCSRIQMEDGAHFNGMITMEKPVPIKVAEEPEIAEDIVA